MLRQARDVERDELRAMRAALLDINRGAKEDEAERLREKMRMEQELRIERHRTAEVVKERNELLALLQIACEKLKKADVKIEAIGSTIVQELTQTVDKMSRDHAQTLECTMKNAAVTHKLLDKMKEIVDKRIMYSGEMLREIETNAHNDCTVYVV